MLRRAKSANPVAPDIQISAQPPLTTYTPVPRPENVSHETMDRLERYVALVRKWTKAISLVSQGDHDIIWSRHVLDSLRLLPLIPQNTVRGADLGSGAGFPGLILALVSNIPFDLIEADRRKAAFLVEAQRATDAPVQVHCARIENLDLPRVPLVTARALAPLTTLLAYADRLLLPGGTALFPKGSHADEEIAAATQRWCMQIQRSDDPQHPGSTILAITGLTHA